MAGRLDAAVEALPEGLRYHIRRVEEAAALLADAHGLDPVRLRIAALGHDLVRHEPDARLLELAAESGLEADDVEIASPILLHGPIAALVLRRDYGVDDVEVLDAIAWHTTGRPGMTAIEQALFVADKIDPHKLARKPALARVAELSTSDLGAATFAYLDLNLIEAVERGWQVHPRTVAARNQLLAEVKERGAKSKGP